MAADELEQSVRLGEWLTILAALLGPVLAVQAQKWVERARERTTRKEKIFHTLMATRNARLSPEHVRALNMIELSFYGTRVLGSQRQSEAERGVNAAWREYHDHFNGLGEGASEEDIRRWNITADELFVNLLEKMAASLNYTFDRVQLKKGWYSPRAHGQIEADQDAIRQGVARLLSGQTSLKMEVTNLPRLNDGGGSE